MANQQIDQIPLTPHRLSYEGRFSLQLLRQAVAGVDIQGFMMSDASKVLAIKTDYLAMFGGGGADEPVGMVNQPGIGSITFGGAPTFASLVNMETALAESKKCVSGFVRSITIDDNGRHQLCRA